MPVRWNVWSFSSFRLAMQSAPPLHQQVVRRLCFTFVLVKTCSCFAAQHLLVAQPEQDSRDMITLPVGFLECVADINRDVYADFVDQPQRTHWHPPLYKSAVDPIRVHAALEQLGSIKQVWKQNAVHQEPGLIAHYDWHFSDLPDKRQAAIPRFVRCLLGNNNFH